MIDRRPIARRLRVHLCWDQDRFGRFNSIEAGHWIYPLMQAGIRLETIAQGKIDWNDFAGRLMYQIQQEGKHQFLRDLARNCLRGLISRVKEGKWGGGVAPYGYEVGDDEHLRLGNPSAKSRPCKKSSAGDSTAWDTARSPTG